jgi:hypothetical protein
MSYHREIASTSTNLSTGTVSVLDAETDLAFTAIDLAAGTIADTLSWTGTLTYVFNATVTRAGGTVVTRHQEGTIEFSGSSTFTVTVDGTTYRYRLADGVRVD